MVMNIITQLGLVVRFGRCEEYKLFSRLSVIIGSIGIITIISNTTAKRRSRISLDLFDFSLRR